MTTTRQTPGAWLYSRPADSSLSRAMIDALARFDAAGAVAAPVALPSGVRPATVAALVDRCLIRQTPAGVELSPVGVAALRGARAEMDAARRDGVPLAKAYAVASDTASRAASLAADALPSLDAAALRVMVAARLVIREALAVDAQHRPDSQYGAAWAVRRWAWSGDGDEIGWSETMPAGIAWSETMPAAWSDYRAALAAWLAIVNGETMARASNVLEDDAGMIVALASIADGLTDNQKDGTT